jgi:hypothetical protein
LISTPGGNVAHGEGRGGGGDAHSMMYMGHATPGGHGGGTPHGTRIAEAVGHGVAGGDAHRNTGHMAPGGHFGGIKHGVGIPEIVGHGIGIGDAHSNSAHMAPGGHCGCGAGGGTHDTGIEETVGSGLQRCCGNWAPAGNAGQSAGVVIVEFAPDVVEPEERFVFGMLELPPQAARARKAPKTTPNDGARLIKESR